MSAEGVARGEGVKRSKGVILGFRVPTTSVGARGERARSEGGQRRAKHIVY